MATSPEESFLQNWLTNLCSFYGIKPTLDQIPKGVEATIRTKDGLDYLFILNHNAEAVAINLGELSGLELLSKKLLSGGQFELAGRDVWIIQLGC